MTQVVAIAGLPGSGKSRLMQELERNGFVRFDDVREAWEENIVRAREAIGEGRAVVITDIMFCDDEWRRTLELALGRAVHWISFSNDPWQCAVNCLYRLMVELDDRPLMSMLQRIAELSPKYRPVGEVRPVVQADAKMRRTTPASG